MKKYSILSIMATLSLLTGCQENGLLLPEQELVVVRAFLFAGEPVTEIQLKTTYPITSDETDGGPINDASVSLLRNGTTYPLVASPGDSGYYHYPGADLQVNVGDEFELLVEHNGKEIRATTAIPAEPEAIAISHSIYTIETPVFNGSPVIFDTSQVKVSWEAEDDAYYFIVVENTETTLTYIDERLGEVLKFLRTFRSRPVQDREYIIRRFDLTYLGNHEVRVYRVNQEYADLYAFGLQDSRSLNEPKSNIENGLGVFAGFSSSMVELFVNKSEN